MSTRPRHQISRSISRRAFTLIELLVVISVIALLIALLLPALSRAQKSSQIVTCGTNMRQQGLAMFFYANDNNDYLPVRPNRQSTQSHLAHSTGSAAVNNSEYWARDYLNIPVIPGGGGGYANLPGSIRNTVLFCPGTRTPIYSETNANTSYWFFNLSYGPDTGLTSGNILTTAAGGWRFVRLARVVEPFRDSNQYGKVLPKPLAQDKTRVDTLNGQWMLNHDLEGGNYLLPDGHVEWVKSDPFATATSVYNPATSPVVRWNQSGAQLLLPWKYMYFWAWPQSGGYPSYLLLTNSGTITSTTFAANTGADQQW